MEPNVRYRLSGDPYDMIDPDTGISYLWAYGAVHAGEALAATSGGSSVPVAVIDTGVDIHHPDLAGRIGASSTPPLAVTSPISSATAPSSRG